MTVGRDSPLHPFPFPSLLPFLLSFQFFPSLPLLSYLPSLSSHSPPSLSLLPNFCSLPLLSPFTPLLPLSLLSPCPYPYLYPLNPARGLGSSAFGAFSGWNQRTFCHLHNDTFVIYAVHLAVYNGDKLTHFTVSKTDDKIPVGQHLGTSLPQLFGSGAITPRTLSSVTAVIRRSSSCTNSTAWWFQFPADSMPWQLV